MLSLTPPGTPTHLPQVLLPEHRPGVGIDGFGIRNDHFNPSFPREADVFHALGQFACGGCMAPSQKRRETCTHTKALIMPAKNGMSSSSKRRGSRPLAFCVLLIHLRPVLDACSAIGATRVFALSMLRVSQDQRE